MTTSPGHGGEVAAVTESVRADIVGGRLRIGNELVIADLAEELAVSMSSVRQALLRLVDQHLVSTAPDGSFQVVSASRRDLGELTALRQLVEGEAIRLSVESAQAGWADRVQVAHDALAAAEEGVEQPGLADEWREAHTAFHEALCSGAGSSRLLVLVGLLRDEAEIYRELAAGTPARRHEVTAQHRDLMERALAGDAEGAAAILRTHLEGTRRSIVRSALEDDQE